MESKIFISYSRRDTEEVQHIVSFIESEVNTKCWIDLNGIESAEDFRARIIEAINKASVVLFMLSENSMESNFAKKEILYAKDDKRIVPICLGDVRPQGWFKFEFAGIDYIRASNKDQMQKLVRDLKKWILEDPIKEEIQKLLEEWKSLQNKQNGILQEIEEKERMIDNCDKTASQWILEQAKADKSETKQLNSKIEELKLINKEQQEEIDALKKRTNFKENSIEENGNTFDTSNLENDIKTLVQSCCETEISPTNSLKFGDFDKDIFASVFYKKYGLNFADSIKYDSCETMESFVKKLYKLVIRSKTHGASPICTSGVMGVASLFAKLNLNDE